MFCPNCGEKVKEHHNFCKYCGMILNEDEKPDKKYALSDEEETLDDDSEEIVLYVTRKHLAGLLLPLIPAPFLAVLFWKVYINFHSVIGLIAGVFILMPVVYTILRNYMDKLIVTNKFVHIRHGVFDVAEINIPIEKINEIHPQQPFLGKIFGYGEIVCTTDAGKCYIRNIENHEELKYIISDPENYIKEALEDDPFVSLSNSLNIV
jgi:membrane protein YdbS with pleckstrin-like domain